MSRLAEGQECRGWPDGPMIVTPNGPLWHQPFGARRLKARPVDADVTAEVTKLSTGPWGRTRRCADVRRLPRTGRLPQVEGVARDEGDVILSWLTRIVMAIAVTAVVGFDSLSIAVTHVSTMDDANTAARVAALAWSAGHGDLSAALTAAQSSAAQHGETVVPASLRADPDGTIHLRLTHVATTMVIRHLGPLRAWGEVTASGTGRVTTP